MSFESDYLELRFNNLILIIEQKENVIIFGNLKMSLKSTKVKVSEKR